METATSFSVPIPLNYGWVLITGPFFHYMASALMIINVMIARYKYDIHYPNLYGVPGYHKNAEEFNRVQRGHQHYFEGTGFYLMISLAAGLKYPVFVSWMNILYIVGSLLYQWGYKNLNLNVNWARFRRGGSRARG